MEDSYKSYQIEHSKEIDPFNSYVEVYCLKIAGLKETSDNVAIEDEFIRKNISSNKIITQLWRYID